MTIYTVVNYEIKEHELGGYTYFTIEPINPRVTITENARVEDEKEVCYP